MTYTYEHPRPGLTVDLVIVCMPQQSVLLIQRGNPPFQGYWAMPGGYVEEGESIPNAAKRELQEETGITEVKLKQMGTYGDPGRDPRGWTATVVFAGQVAEPCGKAGDDARNAQWFPLDRLPEQMAFDHSMILNDVLKKLGKGYDESE